MSKPVIVNPTIQAALDAATTKAAASKTALPSLAQVASDVRDYLEALKTLGRTYNANGICLKADGRLFYFQAEITLVQLPALLVAPAWDLDGLTGVRSELAGALQ